MFKGDGVYCSGIAKSQASCVCRKSVTGACCETSPQSDLAYGTQYNIHVLPYIGHIIYYYSHKKYVLNIQKQFYNISSSSAY